MKDHARELEKLYQNRKPDEAFSELADQPRKKSRLNLAPTLCVLAGAVLTGGVMLAQELNQYDHLAALYQTHPLTYGDYRAVLYQAKKRHCQPSPIVTLVTGFDEATCRTKEAAEMEYAYLISQAPTEALRKEVYSDSPDIDAAISENSDDYKRRLQAKQKARQKAEADRIANALQRQEGLQ